MYHLTLPSTPYANSINSSSWFFNFYIVKPNSDESSPSRLEIMFLLDSGASISVLNIPTFTALAKHFLHCSYDLNKMTNKSIMVANKTQVPILFNVNLTCNLTLHYNSRQFNIPFAVANIKYNILGTPFFESHIKTLDIQNLTLTFKPSHPHENPFTASFAQYQEKDYPFFSYVFAIKAKQPLRFPPQSSKNIHFPIPDINNLPFKTNSNEHIFPTIPHSHFDERYHNKFNILEVLSQPPNPHTCTVFIKNKTNSHATLPQGLIGYIEIPTTNTKPSYYRVYDVNTLVHSLVHSYCPDITEPVPPPRNQSLPSSIKVTPDTFTVNTLQPSTPVNNKFTPPPYSPETLKFINKFNFKFSDITQEEYLTICSILTKYQSCYATHKNDVGQIKTPFRIRLKKKCST